MKLARILATTARVPLSLILVVLSLVTASNLCPIFNFEQGAPFTGKDIYNPYCEADSTLGWTRANFHTHSRASKWINECELWPDSVRTYYDRLGYGLVSFSNHMELTPDPRDTTGQIWVYEHGLNLAKHHNLVFGADKVNWYDGFLPVLVSQKQFKMDMLTRGADFIFFNHPDRTSFTRDREMSLLSGYRLLEADCGFTESSTYCSKWDTALSNGHYAPSAISDDLHEPRLTAKIGRRCSFLNCRSTRYPDVKDCLLSGNFYTAHIPDFGDGDWDEKIRRNSELPAIRSIGLRDGNVVYMELSRPAHEIQVIGQGGQIVKSLADTSSVDYPFRDSDSYVRLVARYDDGTVLMSNPFARWDAGSTDWPTPYRDFAHPVNWPLTILYNLAVLLLALLLLRAGIHAFRKTFRR